MPFDAHAFEASYIAASQIANSKVVERTGTEAFWAYHHRAPRALLEHAWNWNTDRDAKVKDHRLTPEASLGGM